MKKAEIRVGGLYSARISGRYVTVRVDGIREQTGWQRDCMVYDVTNLATGRTTTFRSAAKFRGLAENGGKGPQPLSYEHCQGLIAADKVRAAVRVGYHGEEVDPMRPTEEPEEGASEDECPTQGALGTTPTCLADYAVAISAALDLATSESVTIQVEGEQRSDSTIQDATRIAGASTATSGAESASGATDTTSAHCATTRGDGNTMDTSGTAVPSPAPTSALASKIAALRTDRSVGSPVAGMVPNAEQEAIIALAEARPKVMIVSAGAGTGKTATLKMLEQVLPGKGQYTAFNKSLVEESKSKFVKASVHTTHALAFREVGKKYAHRLNGERVKSYMIARILGIESMGVVLKGMGAPAECPTCGGAGEVSGDDADYKCPTCGGRCTVPTDKLKTLSGEFLAGQVIVAVRKFCQSADREIGAAHLHYIDGIDAQVEELGSDGGLHKRRGRENNDKVRDYLLSFLAKAWADMSQVDGQLPFHHDVYVKIWQLGTGKDRPVIAADYILLDEAQDTAPVFLDILKQQTHAMLVFVGDSNQAIYEWRGATDAMKAFPDAPRRLLSQSYRFGQAIADVANSVLATLEEPTDLVMRGMPGLPSRVAEVAEPRCYLYRTNAGAVGQVMTAIAEGKRPHLVGGGDEVVKWCQAALDLQAKRGTRHPELCCFDTWGEVVEYSKSDEGSDLRLMVKLVEEFGAEAIRDALKDMPKEEDADVVVSTAHKSKGREWDTVKLGPDFPTADKMSDPDRRLLYVAATRAKLVLDVSECPPFCGAEMPGYGEGGGRSQWVPGLSITYTMPTRLSEVKVVAPTRVTDVCKPVVPTVASAQSYDGNGNEFTWANIDGKWCVRGPQGQIGKRVTVVRKNGTKSQETLVTVTRKIGNWWFYEIG